MGVCNSPGNFREKVNEMFRIIEFIREYLDYLLIINKDGFSDHLNKL